MIPISRIAPDAAHCLVPLLRQVHDLHAAHMPMHYTPTPDDAALTGFLRTWLQDPAVTALAAGPADKPVGYLIYEEVDRPASVLRCTERFGMFHHICVDAAARRSGVGAALIAEMRRRLAARSVPRIRVSYAAFNTASASLMSRAGFTPVTIYAEVDTAAVPTSHG